MSRSMLALCLASSFLIGAPAAATVLTVDSGWQGDAIDFGALVSENSVWSFTVDTAAVLSITDAFIPGDIFTISGRVNGATSFFAGMATDAQATNDDYGDAWVDQEYSKYFIKVGPGSYSFSIGGGGASGYPTGLGVRLDSSTSPVPEPASWGLMVLAFGAVGASMRRSVKSMRSAT